MTAFPTYQELCQMCGKAAPHAPEATRCIRVVFVTTHGRIGRLIRWRTWSEGVTHVGIMDEENWVVHADLGKGVREEALPLITKVGNRMDILAIDIPKAAADALWTLARQQVGKRYDLRGNFGFIFRMRMQNPKRWFCSELVAWLFWKAGCPLLARLPSWKYAPEDLWRSPLLRYESSHIVTKFDDGQIGLKWAPPPMPPERTEMPLESLFASDGSIPGRTGDLQNAEKCRGKFGESDSNPMSKIKIGDQK